MKNILNRKVFILPKYKPKFAFPYETHKKKQIPYNFFIDYNKISFLYDARLTGAEKKTSFFFL